MMSLRTILMSSAAAISLAAAPALAQQAEVPAGDQQMQAERSYQGAYGERFADWGDRNIEELVGTPVINDAGENIGEIDDFGLSGDQIVAIVGIGGFLGMGEHSVALPLDQLSFDGERLVLAGVTREELEAMPEYDEGEAQTFAADQTLRSGYEGAPMAPAPGGTAELQPADQPTADQPTADAEQDVAQTDEGEGIATEAEGAGENIAQATEETGEAIRTVGEQAAEGAEQLTETELTEPGESQTEMAAEDVQPAAPEGEQAETAAATTVQETGAAETDMAATGEAEPLAQGEGDAEVAVTEEAEPMAEGDAEMAATDDVGWTEEMDSIFADIADQRIAELIGMDVASADGEVVGQVDNFALQGEDVLAIVGIGGFLGLGGHDVALPLGEMTYDGERLVLSSLTEDQLREMPEFEEGQANYLPEEGTLRGTYDQ